MHPTERPLDQAGLDAWMDAFSVDEVESLLHEGSPLLKANAPPKTTETWGATTTAVGIRLPGLQPIAFASDPRAAPEPTEPTGSLPPLVESFALEPSDIVPWDADQAAFVEQFWNHEELPPLIEVLPPREPLERLPVFDPDFATKSDTYATNIVAYRRKKHAVDWLSSLLFYCALAVIVTVALLYSNNPNEIKNVLGYSYFTITTSSMVPKMPPGTLILTHKTPTEQLAQGDVITFWVEGVDQPITHEIVEVLTDSGEPKFRTKGTNNNAPDPELTSGKNVVGKVIFFAKGVGAAMQRVQNRISIYLFLFVILIALSFTLPQVFRKDDFQPIPPTRKKSRRHS